MDKLELSPESLLANIQLVNQVTKEDLVKRYYPKLTNFDYALPVEWIRYMIAETKESYTSIVDSFVWGYTMYNQDLGGIPLPLNEFGANLLIQLEDK